MTDPAPNHDESAPRAPRWAKVFGAVALVVVILVVVMLLAGGSHGPGRHLGSDHGALRPAPAVPPTAHAG